MTQQKFVALILLSGLLVQPLRGQAVAGNAVASERLTIFVLQGDRAVNNTQAQRATAPVVEVRGANELPAEGATVTFELPPSGPGGHFFGNQTVQTTKTNAQGQAAPTAYVVNNQLGEFKIKVTAVLGNSTATASIAQTNSASQYSPIAARKRHFTWWEAALIAGAGVGIALGVHAATSSSTPTQPVTITTGGITIGGPH